MAVSRLSQQSLQNAFPKGNTVWDGTTATSAFDSLGVYVLASNTTSITFSNIPQTYSHLQLRVIARGSSGSGAGELDVRLGTGTASSSSIYSRHNFGVYSPTSSTSGVDYNTTATTTTFRGCGQVALASDLANVYGSMILDVLDYTSTSKLKTIRSITGVNDNNNGLCSNIYYTAGLWQASTAVNVVNIYLHAGSDFLPYSSFALYGVK